jgi:hypothetical protein
VSFDDAHIIFIKPNHMQLDSVCRSPIYALLGETLDGVLTIRAFEAEKSLSDRMVGMLNTQQTAYHLTFSSQSWLSLRLEFAGTLIIASACLLAVLEHPVLGGNEHFAGKSMFRSLLRFTTAQCEATLQ